MIVQTLERRFVGVQGLPRDEGGGGCGWPGPGGGEAGGGGRGGPPQPLGGPRLLDARCKSYNRRAASLSVSYCPRPPPVCQCGGAFLLAGTVV